MGLRTLNSKAQIGTGILSARCITAEDIAEIVGENNMPKHSEYGNKYNYYFDKSTLEVYSKKQTAGSNTWEDPKRTYRRQIIFIGDDGNKVIIDKNNPEETVTIEINGIPLRKHKLE